MGNLEATGKLLRDAKRFGRVEPCFIEDRAQLDLVARRSIEDVGSPP